MRTAIISFRLLPAWKQRDRRCKIISASVKWTKSTSGDTNIAQDFAGQTVADILTRKKASIKQARLPQGAPDWESLLQMTWEQIDAGASANRPGFKTIRKLLTDKRFDR